MKAWHRSARWLGALLIVAATDVAAQQGANTQRPLRPGQVRGPKFMVPVLKSNEQGLGAQFGEVLRDRMMSDYLATTMFVVPTRDIRSQLEASGYSATEALGSNDLRMLAGAVQADEYLDGTVSRTPEGTLSFKGAVLLPRPEGMVQPLPEVTGARPGDLAGRVSDEIEKARKHLPHVQRCLQNARSNAAEAMDAAQRALREFPSSVPARVCVLDLVFERKNMDSVITVAEEILSQEPNHSKALRYAADAYFEKKMEDKYVETVMKVVALNPTDTELSEQVVNMLGEIGKADVAKPIIDTAVKNNPGDPSLIRLQWRIYRALKDWKGVVAVGEEMIKTDTSMADTTFWHAMVAAYVADSQPQKAQEAAARGAAKFPNVPSLWISVAQLARQNGQLPQALEAINRVVAVDPKYPGASLQKAQIYSEMDQVDSMVATLQVAVQNGADTAMASGMIATKGNQLFRAWGQDSAKTVDQGRHVLGILAAADSIGSTPTTSLLIGLTELTLANMLLAEAREEPRSCEKAQEGSKLIIDAQVVLPKAGRQFPNETA
ncbi:MAG TPA: tetratricopeptide repeat protein, partial [Gemmatimonadaceae bacterium]|nr:tetratricopeptide repeat protein [Gemmatimonadaceae bacterium]